MRGFVQRLGVWAILVATMVCAPALALAAPDGPPATDRGTGFVPVTGNEAETVPGGLLLVLAYGVIWVLLMVYVVSIWRRQSRLDSEIAELSKRIAEHAK